MPLPLSTINRQSIQYSWISVNYINTIINPNEVEYLSYQIQPMNYVIFSAIKGSEIHYIFAVYQIQTDTIFWPFQDYKTDRGVLVPDRSAGKSFTVSTNPQYVVAALAKFSQSLFQCRSCLQFSVIRLVGAVSGLLFMLKAQNDASHQITIAQTLFPEYCSSKASAKVANTDLAFGKEEKSVNQIGKQKKFLNSILLASQNQVFTGFKKRSNTTLIGQMQRSLIHPKKKSRNTSTQGYSSKGFAIYNELSAIFSMRTNWFLQNVKGG